MSIPATPGTIIRCIRKDYGTRPADLRAGAAYCERIGRAALMNPWAPAEDAGAYLEASRCLEAQAREQEGEVTS